MKKGLPPGKPLISATFGAVRPDMCCIKITKKIDVVVTNPPFSLFREYVAQLIQYQKHFVIIGNMNAIHYKEVFPLIQDNKVWIGPSIHSGDRAFNVPDDYPLNAAGCGIDKNGRKFIRVKGVRWFTNIDIEQRHEELILYKNYAPNLYPKYTNYDAIDVSKVSDIPCDYYGKMGVPVSFLDKHSPEQFEIIGLSSMLAKPIASCVLPTAEYQKGGNEFYLQDSEHHYKRLFSRIVIRRMCK